MQQFLDDVRAFLSRGDRRPERTAWLLDVWVEGVPAPQGSKWLGRIGQRVVPLEASKRLRPWRKTIASVVRGAWQGEPYAQACQAVLLFYLPLPLRVIAAGEPWPWPTMVQGDLDKLCRAVLDSCVDGGALRDDRYVVSLVAEARYGRVPGVMVALREAG